MLSFLRQCSLKTLRRFDLQSPCSSDSGRARLLSSPYSSPTMHGGTGRASLRSVICHRPESNLRQLHTAHTALFSLTFPGSFRPEKKSFARTYADTVCMNQNALA
ncbi:uncharacterized protein LOC122250594 [Penaeus japonicus]|uniref:uncharacterized protein LOC122250594 n=1 Tax=Penaeus japonicus TaxID=27405 RepID=UPI001C70C68A|nr:uncharacterized protein LOC122250594 [Penaeus japonicus]